MAKTDPMVLIGAGLGAATIALGKPREPITPSQMLANMCAAFACGYFAPEAVAAYYPQAEKFMGLVAFLCAVVGVGVTTRIITRVPQLIDKWLVKKASDIVDAAAKDSGSKEG